MAAPVKMIMEFIIFIVVLVHCFINISECKYVEGHLRTSEVSILCYFVTDHNNLANVIQKG